MPLPEYLNFNINKDGVYLPDANGNGVSTPIVSNQPWAFGSDYVLPSVGTGASFFPGLDLSTSGFSPIWDFKAFVQSFDFSNLWNGMNFGGGFNFGNFADFNANSFVFNPTSSSSSASVSDKTEYEKVEALLKKAVELTKAKKGEVKLNSAELNTVNEALKSSGTTDEKMEAMTAALESIPESKRNKIIAAMYKDDLTNTGYQDYTKDKTLSSKYTAVHDVLSNLTTSDGAASAAVKDLVGVLGDDSKKILTAISAWNTNYSSSGCILGDIISKVENVTDGNIKTALLDNQIKPLVDAMLTASLSVIDDLKDEGYDVSSLNVKRTALQNANSGLTFDKNKLKTLADAFKELYVAMRISLAKQMDDNINNDYGFLNLSDDENQMIKTDLVSTATNDDLRNEGLSAIEFTAGEKEAEATDFSEMDTDDALDSLVTADNLESKTVGNVTYYVTKSGDNAPKRYYYKDGDDIKEIKNATAIDNNGNITFRGATTQTLSAYIEAQKDKEDNVVTPEVIEETAKSLKVLNDMVAEGRLRGVVNNTEVFSNVGSCAKNNGNRNHYYTINSEGKLCEIKYSPNASLAIKTFDNNIITVDTIDSTFSYKDANYENSFMLEEVEKDDIVSMVPLESEMSVPTTKAEFEALGIKPVRMYKKAVVEAAGLPCFVDYSLGEDCYQFNGKYYTWSIADKYTAINENEWYISDSTDSSQKTPQDDFTTEEINTRSQEIRSEIFSSRVMNFTIIDNYFVKKVLRYEKLTGIKIDFTKVYYETETDQIGRTTSITKNSCTKFLEEYERLKKEGIENYESQLLQVPHDVLPNPLSQYLNSTNNQQPRLSFNQG